MKDPILYVDKSPSSDAANVAAAKLLDSTGLAYRVRPASTGYRAAYRTPVLFALWNKFEGLKGIRIFVENSILLSGSINGAKSRRRK